LRSTVTISSAPLHNVLLVPNLFIAYNEHRNEYFVDVRRGSSSRQIVVEAGPSDGVVRAVRGDLNVGDRLSRPEVGEVQP
jgi:hypothetical protein